MTKISILSKLLAASLALPLIGAGAVPTDAPADVVTAAVDRATGALETVGCEAGFELVEGIGCARRLDDGMVEHVGPDGEVSTTHGHDAGHPEEVAGSSSRALPTKRRPLVCTPNGGYRAVVLYAHQGNDRRSSHLGTIRQTVERSNQAVASSASRSGGPLADLRVKCTSGGAISVASVRVPNANFADVKAALAKAGYDRANEKYLIFGDFSSPQGNVAGIGDLYLDARRDVNNNNNGTRAMYGLVYGPKNFGGSVALHELSHTMGAVQPKAPKADGYGHCQVNEDVLCYPSSSTKCAKLVFDCGNDTYFSTKTRAGQWLHSNWNLGWEGNRFIRFTAASTSSGSKPSSAPAKSSGKAYALVGDWVGSDRDGIGWWRDGRVRLRTPAGELIEFDYGRAGDIPVVGDWNGNGRDSLGIVRDGTWHLKNVLGGGRSDRSFSYGRVTQGDVPITGDWNGTGIDTPGIIRDGAWHLRNSHSGGKSHERFTYGRLTRGDRALIGDWRGTGADRPGIVRRGQWHLRNTLAGGAADISYTYGRVASGDRPIMGDWNGDERATPGIVRGSTWYLKLRHEGGRADREIVLAPR